MKTTAIVATLLLLVGSVRTSETRARARVTRI
jgi:hypothetical protein